MYAYSLEGREADKLLLYLHICRHILKTLNITLNQSANLFSHILKADFLTKRLIYADQFYDHDQHQLRRSHPSNRIDSQLQTVYAVRPDGAVITLGRPFLGRITYVSVLLVFIIKQVAQKGNDRSPAQEKEQTRRSGATIFPIVSISRYF